MGRTFPSPFGMPSPFDGFRQLGRRGGAAVDGGTLVRALLANGSGFARDPADALTVFSDVAGSVFQTPTGPATRMGSIATATVGGIADISPIRNATSALAFLASDRDAAGATSIALPLYTIGMTTTWPGYL